MKRAPWAVTRNQCRNWHSSAVAALLALAASVVAPSPARAEGELNLVYEAPADCGSADEVRGKLARAKGEAEPEDAVSEGSSGTRTSGAVTAQITVTGEGQRYQVDFAAENDGVKSGRRLVVDSCEAVTEAAALLLLLTMDPVLARALGVEEPAGTTEVAPAPSDGEAGPSATVEPAATAPIPTASDAPVAADPIDEIGPRERSPETRQAHDVGAHGWVGVGPGLVHGTAPALALGPVLGTGFGYGLFRASGIFGWHRASSAALPGVEGGTVEADLLRGSAGAGVQFGTPGLRFGPVVGVGFERMTASSLGVSTPGEGSTSWATVHGAVEVTALISKPWALVGRAGAVLPLTRPRFRIEGEPRAAHQPAPVGVEGLLAISWAWGSQFQ